MLVSKCFFSLQILAKTYTLGARKTYDRIQESYYGITEPMVEWVVDLCLLYPLYAKNQGKLPIKPIKVKYCMDHFVIDLMDFRASADGVYKWILQKKDLFSWYIWLDPLEDKTANRVCQNLTKWFGENGHLRKLYISHLIFNFYK